MKKLNKKQADRIEKVGNIVFYLNQRITPSPEDCYDCAFGLRQVCSNPIDCSTIFGDHELLRNCVLVGYEEVQKEECR